MIRIFDSENFVDMSFKRCLSLSMSVVRSEMIQLNRIYQEFHERLMWNVTSLLVSFVQLLFVHDDCNEFALELSDD